MVTLFSYLVIGVWGASKFSTWVQSEIERSRRTDEQLQSKISSFMETYNNKEIEERISVLESKFNQIEANTERIEAKTDRILNYLLDTRVRQREPHQGSK